MSSLNIDRDPERIAARQLAAEQLLAELRMPADSSWVHIKSIGQVSARAPWVRASLNFILRDPHIPDILPFHLDEPLELPGAQFKDWDGYRFEFFGLAVAKRPTLKPDWPYLNIPFDVTNPEVTDDPEITGIDLLVQLWLQRAQHQTDPIAGELRWWPGASSLQGVITYPSGQENEKVLRRANRGIGLLLRNQGLTVRRRRGPKANPEKDQREILQAAANILSQHKIVSRGLLANDLTMSLDGFDDKRERSGLDLTYLENLTLSQLKKLGISAETNTIRRP